MIDLTNLNKGYVNAVYNGDKIVSIYTDKEDAEYILNANPTFILKEKQCFEFYENGNISKEAYELTIVNLIVSDKVKEFAFNNSTGFALCALKLYFNKNNEEFTIEQITNYYYSYDNYTTDINCYKINPLIKNLLNCLTSKNFCVIANLINYILSYQCSTEEELKEYEFNSTHYTKDGETFEIPIEQVKNKSDICLFDNLTLDGFKNYSVIEKEKKQSSSKDDLIKWVTIYEFFASLEVTYVFQFYKLILNNKVEDPFEFID